jgi:GNAT superfamily N-acetyltransferase
MATPAHRRHVRADTEAAIHRSAAPVSIEPADPLGAEALALLAEAVDEARARYPELFDPTLPPPTNEPLRAGTAFLLARSAGRAVGCGALRALYTSTAEVRRMFVSVGARRRGLARALLAELERQALALGYSALRLETGNRQPEAVALYTACGYLRIAPFGRYADDPTSVCFEKHLPTSAAAADRR